MAEQPLAPLCFHALRHHLVSGLSAVISWGLISKLVASGGYTVILECGALSNHGGLCDCWSNIEQYQYHSLRYICLAWNLTRYMLL